MDVEHDLRSMQAFIEARFNALDRRQDDTLQLISTTTTEARHELVKLTAAVELTNGRVRKAEVAIAVLKFAVFTIGGALLLASMQVLVAKLSGGM